MKWNALACVDVRGLVCVQLHPGKCKSDTLGLTSIRAFSCSHPVAKPMKRQPVDVFVLQLFTYNVVVYLVPDTTLSLPASVFIQCLSVSITYSLYVCGSNIHLMIVHDTMYIHIYMCVCVHLVVV